MDRYVCIHGHFYQPPRENPWLDVIEVQDEAFPHHDWNERITAECYATNCRSRILNGDGRIERIVNNYARMSFDFGPTLLRWLEDNAQDVYYGVLAADRESQDRFSGHGSAMAQAYNHVIMPLADSRDKRTQVIWGIVDFERRFGRRPEGMWLPETAVDLETLDILSEMGIRFTVLAPHQARRVRPLTGGQWQDASDARVDPSRAYEARLPSGRRISLFFYDGPTSRAVAFERLLDRGEEFANRVLGIFSEGRSWPQIAHIATDGETYGHHHRFGDMALAYALEYVQSNDLALLTNYGEYLERHPPAHEAEIYESTSWSCVHGVERWRSDCGCNAGSPPGWNQKWRAPLRESLDWLRDVLAPLCQERAAGLLGDAWAARDDYVEVVLDQSEEGIARFLSRHADHALTRPEMTTAIKLMEVQRHAMLMYTSCGWFFNDVSGIETQQVLQYAGRAIQLAEEVFGVEIEAEFLERLSAAESNHPRFANGAEVYQRFVGPAKVDLHRVAAHYAVSSLFEDYEDETDVYLYQVRRNDLHTYNAGRTKLAVGSLEVSSRITGECSDLSFGVLHFGEHNITGGVGELDDAAHYERLVEDAAAAFAAADLTEVIRIMDDYFPGRPFSIRSLFRDEQRKIIATILEGPMSQAETIYRQFYEENVSLMRFLNSVGYPMPNRFRAAAEFALNLEMRRALGLDDLDTRRIQVLLDEAAVAGVTIDAPGVSLVLKNTLERLAQRFAEQPADVATLDRLVNAARVANQAPFDVDLWRTQNTYYDLLQSAYPGFHYRATEDDEARGWIDRFGTLGDLLRVRVEP